MASATLSSLVTSTSNSLMFSCVAAEGMPATSRLATLAPCRASKRGGGAAEVSAAAGNDRGLP